MTENAAGVGEAFVLQQRITVVEALLRGAVRPAGSSAEIDATERRLAVMLPADARALVSVFDGSVDSTPVANGWVTFWPMSAWQRAGDIDDLEVADDLRDVILFADHSLDSWWYALRIDPQFSQSRVYCVTGVPKRDCLVAATLSDFLQAIIDDGNTLYPDL